MSLALAIRRSHRYESRAGEMFSRRAARMQYDTAPLTERRSRVETAYRRRHESQSEILRCLRDSRHRQDGRDLGPSRICHLYTSWVDDPFRVARRPRFLGADLQ